MLQSVEITFKPKDWEYHELKRSYSKDTKIQEILSNLNIELGLVENLKLFYKTERIDSHKNQNLRKWLQKEQDILTLIYDYTVPAHHTTPILSQKTSMWTPELERNESE